MARDAVHLRQQVPIGKAKRHAWGLGLPGLHRARTCGSRQHQQLPGVPITAPGDREGPMTHPCAPEAANRSAKRLGRTLENTTEDCGETRDIRHLPQAPRFPLKVETVENTPSIHRPDFFSATLLKRDGLPRRRSQRLLPFSSQPSTTVQGLFSALNLEFVQKRWNLRVVGCPPVAL